MSSNQLPPLAMLKSDIKKVAIVRALHIGDLLMAVPAWRALRKALPEAEITLIGLPWAKQFIQRYSKYIDRWVEFPGYPGMLEVEEDSTRTDAFFRDARQYGYDLAIQMHGDGSVSNHFTAGLGAKYTVGFRRNGRPTPNISFTIPYPENTREVIRHLMLMESLGAEPQGVHLEFPLEDADHKEVAQLPELSEVLESDRKPSTALIIGIHPGARPPARRWEPARFAAVADRLVALYAAKIVLMAGPTEESFANEVQQEMSAECINIAGKLSVGGLAALLSRIDLYIGNDSGPAHIAEAVGTKSITLFGPADPNRWAPLDQSANRIIYKKVGCSPCPYWECPIDHRCLRRIRVSDVVSVAQDLLEPKESGERAIIEFRGAYEQKETEDSNLAYPRIISELHGPGTARLLSAH